MKKRRKKIVYQTLVSYGSLNSLSGLFVVNAFFSKKLITWELNVQMFAPAGSDLHARLGHFFFSFLPFFVLSPSISTCLSPRDTVRLVKKPKKLSLSNVQSLIPFCSFSLSLFLGIFVTSEKTP